MALQLQPAAVCAGGSHKAAAGSVVALHNRMAVHQPRLRPCRRAVVQPAHRAVVRRAAARTAAASAATATQTAPAPTPGTSSTPSTSTSSLLQGFKWNSWWWPVHVLDAVDPTRPHAVELLGKQVVIWKDGATGKWSAAEDACPHRLAPLSEGRLQEGQLLCSYHGWRFDGSGACVDIPQALDAKAKGSACASSRSCLAAFAVREAFGLLWVWPDSGPDAAAAAAASPLPVSKGLQAAAEAGQPLRWYRRQLPYSWDVLIENLTDPSHLPFSHHKLMGGMDRKNGGPMPFTPVTDIPPADDETAHHHHQHQQQEGAGSDGGASKKQQQQRPNYCLPFGPGPVAAYAFASAASPDSHVCFNAPSAVVYTYTLGHLGGDALMQNDLLAVPAGPGRSYAYTIATLSTPPVSDADLWNALLTAPMRLPTLLMRAWFQRRPVYLAHLLSNKLFDQDNVFLNMQDREMALRGRDQWRRDYYMPAPCDGLVVAARRWATEALQLPVWSPPPARTPAGAGAGAPAATAATAATAAALFSLSKEAAAASKRMTVREINDRQAQHTQDCVLCQAAMRQLQRRLAVAQATAGACAAALLGLLGASLLRLLPTAGGAAAAAATAAPVALGPLATVAAALALGAAAALAVARWTQGQLRQFFYIEFAHATNH